MNKTVFISFSSQEADEANKLCQYLEENEVSCFISTRDLIPGREYAEQLVDNISNSKMVVLLLSKASNSSPHVLREVEYAVSHRIPLVVYPLEEVTLSKSMEYFLMTHQWITNTENKKLALLSSIYSAISAESEQKGSLSSNELLRENPNRRNFVQKNSKKLTRIVGAAFLTIALIIGLVFITKRFSDSGSGNTSDESTGLSGIDIAASGNDSTDTAVSFAIGDTVTFGTYYDAPVEWRIIKINGDGTAILLSKYILTMKVFDAAEGGEYNTYNDIYYGSYENHVVTDPDLLALIRGNNNWAKSNIRTWLNSDKEVVDYEDQAPTKAAVGNNYYHSEAGFLYGFSEAEKEALVKTVHGSEDYVFLLSSDELQWLRDAGISIYTKPTEQCKAHDQYIGYYNSDVEYNHTENYYWWLRDNSGEDVSKGYIVTTEAEDVLFTDSSVGAGNYGIRPAITVHLTGITQ